MNEQYNGQNMMSTNYDEMSIKELKEWCNTENVHTIINYCAKNNYVAAVELLLNSLKNEPNQEETDDIMVEDENEDIFTMMKDCVIKDNVEMIELFLKYPYIGCPTIHNLLSVAVEHNSMGIIGLLEKYYTKKSTFYRALLKVGIECDNLVVVEIAIKNNSKSDHPINSQHYRAIARSKRSMLQFLLTLSQNLGIQIIDCNDLVIYYIKYERESAVIDFLLSDVFDVPIKPNTIWYALDYFTGDKNKIVQLLIQKGVYRDDDWQVVFNICSQRGYIEIIKALVDAGACIDPSLNSMLTHAVENDHIDIVTMIIRYGANVSYDDDAPLQISARMGYHHIAKLLIDNGANSVRAKNRALTGGIRHGHYKIVALLIDNGANISCVNSEMICAGITNGKATAKNGKATIKNGKSTTKMLSLLLENNIRFECDVGTIMNCVRRGHIEIIILLIENGISIHIDDHRVLAEACKGGFVNMVELLIEFGADMTTGEALCCACNKGYTEIAALLIRRGAPICEDVLCVAVSQGYTEIVNLLINVGVDIGANGERALFYSIEHGYIGIVQLLLDNYASNFLDKAYALSIESGYDDITKLLIDYGANI